MNKCQFINELMAEIPPGLCIICEAAVPLKPPHIRGRQRRMHVACIPAYQQIIDAERKNRGSKK